MPDGSIGKEVRECVKSFYYAAKDAWCILMAAVEAMGVKMGAGVIRVQG